MTEFCNHFTCSVLKTRPRNAAVRIGDVLGAGTRESFLQLQKTSKVLHDFWQAAFSPDYLSHLRLAGLKNGVLLVLTDSPSYRFELYLCSFELIKQMRQQNIHVKKIDCVFGDFTNC